MKTPAEERTSYLSRRFVESQTLSQLYPLAIEIKTILVPLDFSRGSMETLNYAVPLVKKFGAAVHLVHVTRPSEASVVPGVGHLMRETAASFELLRGQLSESQRKRLSPVWPENCHVRAGQPYQEICDLACGINAGLIVIGTSGHTGLKRILLGSIAERVVRFATCHVLVVRRRGRKQPKEFVLRQILAPIDFSQCGLSGAIYAAFLARTFDPISETRSRWSVRLTTLFPCRFRWQRTFYFARRIEPRQPWVVLLLVNRHERQS